jgi:hypothetical protein
MGYAALTVGEHRDEGLSSVGGRCRGLAWPPICSAPCTARCRGGCSSCSFAVLGVGHVLRGSMTTDTAATHGLLRVECHGDDRMQAVQTGMRYPRGMVDLQLQLLIQN